MSDQGDHTPEERALVEAMAAIWHDVMSDGDKSGAVAIADLSAENDAVVMTSPGAPNDRLWTLMVQLGWARPSLEDIPDFAKDNPEISIKTFRQTELGREMFPQFVQAVR